MTQTRYFALQGGLDMVTPAIQTPAGRVIAGINYEPHPRGYQRVDGFERFDGRPKPSEASYWVLRFKSGMAAINEDDIIEGGTSGATGRAVIDAVVESGDYGDGDAAGYLVIMGLSGEFQDGEDIEVSTVKMAEADGEVLDRGATNDEDDQNWFQAAVEKTRADIQAVPGSGPIRGVWAYKGAVYAFRDDQAETECIMHKSTPSGWQAQSLGRELRFTDGGLLEIEFENGGVLSLPFTSGGSYEVKPSDTITGATSGATATVKRVVVDSGTWGDGDAAGVLVLEADQTGTFQAENLNVGSNNDVATISSDSSLVEIQADDIIVGEDTGAFAIVVQVILDDGAWADGDAAGRLVLRHKSPGMSFVAEAVGTVDGIPAIAEVTGDSIVLAIEEGDTITGGTSGATAVVTRVVLESGDWSTHDAKGRLIFATQSGDFEAETIATGDQDDLATIAGDSDAITLPPGGRYDFVNYNFYGSSDLMRMYGVNGVGRGFEWDGSVFVPIETGMVDDKPIRIEAHKNHLFFAFRGGSLQHSSIGNPYQWQVITGAGELGIGEEITDLLGSVAGILSIFGRNKVAVLFGDDSQNWQLQTLSDNSGAEPWTAQAIGSPIYLDNAGLRSLETTDAFGDFQIGTITRAVEPLFRIKRRAGVKAAAGLRVRAKDQYRLFWSDGTGITVYFGRQAPEILPFDLGFSICCASSGKDEDGEEILLVGRNNGMVYELDAGTSFDGEAITAYLRLPFNHVGSPSQRKRWQKAVIEMDGGPNTMLGMTAEYGYADPDQPPAQEQTFNVRGSGGFWNEMLWDNFYWSSPVEGQAEASIDGLGRNISITVVSEATYEEPHVLHGLLLHFTYRGIVR